MPTLTGVFGQFRNLDKIPIEKIRQWLKNKGEIHQLQNFIGNRIIYSQTISPTAEDLEIDLAILREAIRLEPQVVFNKLTNKINLPAELIGRFPPLYQLVMAIVSVMRLSGITQVYLKNPHQLVGTVITVKPNLLARVVAVSVNGQIKKIPTNGMTYLKADGHYVRLKIGDQEQQLVSGGQFGILVNFIK